MKLRAVLWMPVCLVLMHHTAAAETLGYYRQPTLHDTTLVFVAEGDLWKVPTGGGAATRLTSHLSEESLPAISPDGSTLAFAAQYEGATEIYTMPLAGGRVVRRTFDGSQRIDYVGWTPDGKLLYATQRFSTLPGMQLVLIDPAAPPQAEPRSIVPLAQAADGDYNASGETLFFTRHAFQGSHTKRYVGGTAQQIWKYVSGAAEAVPLTGGYAGTSKRPLWWAGRVYFASDRDGTMNLWSMAEDGSDLKQHTSHAGWDVIPGRLHAGRIVYQLGADLHLYEIATSADHAVPITLDSDFDQTRERWIKRPAEYTTSFHPSADGDRAVITARGRLFVAPARSGRLLEAGRMPDRKPGEMRYYDAQFFPDGNSLAAFSDASGEVELWRLPANGVGAGEQLTRGGSVVRLELAISPNGKHIAHTDKDQRLHLYDVERRQDRQIDASTIDEINELRWSPDSQWLAYVVPGGNLFRQIKLYSLAFGSIVPVTTDRFDSFSPAWSSDGKWLYLLSDRHLRSVVKSPWGIYQPEPFLDRRTQIYQVALVPGQRSPFQERDELQPPKPKSEPPASTPPEVRISLYGLSERLQLVPAPPGNYTALSANPAALFWLARPSEETPASLTALPITSERPEVKTIAADVTQYELSSDGKKLLLQKGPALHLIDAAPAPATLDKSAINLSEWAMAVSPREEWRQMFHEAWRMERDYFYDRGLHGVDWQAIRERYRPLVDRVASRAELSDLLAQMVSELAALHIFVRGGDARLGQDNVVPAQLGGELRRDPAAGGHRVERVYLHDPDEPDTAPPLARPGVGIQAGDVITMINGQPTATAELGALLRHTAHQQTLLRVKPAGGAAERDVIVSPVTPAEAEDLRYRDWEYSRRLFVDKLAGGQIGYVHLRAMGGDNFSEWARNFYPIFTRQGLIIDVRNNKGGNIDSWILGRLLRKAWFYWSQHSGRQPLWNMQFAFRGHVAVICNEWTASDGEAFSEGIKRLKIGKVIGTRTWGGEIWLSMKNLLVDRGLASAAEFGVFGPEGAWLIEGHGVEPDIVVDNLPHATFQGDDAQLRAAVDYLQQKIAAEPVTLPEVPKHPDKSWKPPVR